MSETVRKELLVQIIVQLQTADAQNTEGDYDEQLVQVTLYVSHVLDEENVPDDELLAFFNKVWDFYFSTCTDGYVVTVRENDEH